MTGPNVPIRNPYPVNTKEWLEWMRGNAAWSVDEEPSELEPPRFVEGWQAAQQAHTFKRLARLCG
jgi:hypothetical protein